MAKIYFAGTFLKKMLTFVNRDGPEGMLNVEGGKDIIEYAKEALDS